MASHTLHVVQAFEEKDGGIVPAEPSDVGFRHANAVVEHRRKCPGAVFRHEFRVGVHRLRRVPVAGLNQHVAHVEEKALEIVGRDP